MKKENIIILGLAIVIGLIFFAYKPIQNFGQSGFYSYSVGTNTSSTLTAASPKALTQAGDTTYFGMVCNVGVGVAFLNLETASTSVDITTQGVPITPFASSTGDHCFNATGFTGSLVGYSVIGTVISVMK